MSQQLSLGVSLPDTTRFDNFFPGPNAEVLAQVKTLSDGQSLYLHGGDDSGRSHLLQAACRQINDEGGQAFFLPLRELISADPALLDGLESAQLIALDDVDAMAGNAAWETALFHLFNRLRDAHVPLLMSASDRPDARQQHDRSRAA